MASQRVHFPFVCTPELARTACGQLFPIADAPLARPDERVTCQTCQRTHIYRESDYVKFPGAEALPLYSDNTPEDMSA